MDFKVDYIKVDEIGNNLEKQDEDLAESFEDLLKIIDKLKDSWDGIDYNNFKATSCEYILGLNGLIGELDYLAKFMKKASKTYSDNDLGWLEKVKKIGRDENESKKYYIEQ